MKIYSLLTSAANKTTTNHDHHIYQAHAHSRCQSYLPTVAVRATNRAPGVVGDFRAIILSVGKLVEMKSADELKNWRRDLDP